MEELISNIINNFDWSYMLSVNVLTYTINKLLDAVHTKKTSSWIKKLTTLIVIIVLTSAYILLDKDISYRILLNSAILAPVAWDFIFKPLLNKIGLNYKDE